MRKKDLDRLKRNFLKKYPLWLTEIGETKVREIYAALGQTSWFFGEEVRDKEMAQKINFAQRVLAWVLRSGVPLGERD